MAQLARKTALARYTALCEAIHGQGFDHDQVPVDLMDQIGAAWTDLALRTRVRLILTGAYRQIADEVAADRRRAAGKVGQD